MTSAGFPGILNGKQSALPLADGSLAPVDIFSQPNGWGKRSGIDHHFQCAFGYRQADADCNFIEEGRLDFGLHDTRSKRCGTWYSNVLGAQHHGGLLGERSGRSSGYT